MVPLVEPGSTSVHVSSGRLSSTAWVWEAPGSSGASLRSISGTVPCDTLRRPIRIWGRSSGIRRSGQYGGKASPSSPLSRSTVS